MPRWKCRAVRLAAAGLRLVRPGGLLVASEQSARLAVPAAVGAAIVCPGRDVVALADEQGVHATRGALATAVAMRAAPLVCVLGSGQQPSEAFEPLAHTAGWHHFRIVCDQELDTVLPAVLDRTRMGEPATVELALDSTWQATSGADSRRGCLTAVLRKLSWQVPSRSAARQPAVRS
jgi:thiamine pyrophosphate-dependent acetolactate synthase large subunit-like protein